MLLFVDILLLQIIDVTSNSPSCSDQRRIYVAIVETLSKTSRGRNKCYKPLDAVTRNTNKYVLIGGSAHMLITLNMLACINICIMFA